MDSKLNISLMLKSIYVFKGLQSNWSCFTSRSPYKQTLILQDRFINYGFRGGIINGSVLWNYGIQKILIIQTHSTKHFKNTKTNRSFYMAETFLWHSHMEHESMQNNLALTFQRYLQRRAKILWYRRLCIILIKLPVKVYFYETYKIPYIISEAKGIMTVMSCNPE